MNRPTLSQARIPILLAFALSWVAINFTAHAHRLSDGCLFINATPLTLLARLDLPLRDLNEILPLDPNGDGSVTWGELRQQSSAIQQLIEQKLALHQSAHSLPLRFEPLRVTEIAGEPAASIAFSTDWKASEPLEITYHLLFDVDPQHRGLLRWSQGDSVSTFVFSPDRTRFEPPGTTSGSPPTGALANSWFHYVIEGVHHIWIGYDHILFLLALLLPAVLVRTEPPSSTRVELRHSALRVLKVVTAFTAAHSITLALAAFGWVQLPSRWVETCIAASVAIAAANNLLPFFRERGWAVAFGFGLIHGFGFAGVLTDLDLPRQAFASALVGFNVGVELGQLAIVGVFLPVAYLLRESWFYRRVAVQFGSALIILASLLWVAERGLGWSI
ncbi:MAG: HupE/UreJ family protein [Verrucomicrobiales bacterium]|nr:HupE/UreJ family protein [Verrucomicrobiales bacterium]